jgi:lipid-A-disaccharide synthase
MTPPRPKSLVKSELGLDPDRRMLLLMPGSRRHLVKQLLPIMIEAAGGIQTRYPGLTVALAQADTLTSDFLAPYLDGAGDIKAFAGRSHSLQNAADAAIVASGTSTLETALMLTPMVVIYRMGFISALLASQLIKTKHVAMANLIAGREVVPELLQYKARPDRIIAELERIFNEPGVKRRMVDGLAGVRAKLGGPGASRRAAELLLQTIGG